MQAGKKMFVTRNVTDQTGQKCAQVVKAKHKNGEMHFIFRSTKSKGQKIKISLESWILMQSRSFAFL